MEQISQFAKKFGISGGTLGQAHEYYRIFNVKCSNWMRQLSSEAVSTVCIELACAKDDIQFDKDLALRLSGLKSQSYSSAHQVVEKNLDLEKVLSLKDLAVRFGSPEAEDLAEQVLDLYKDKKKKEMGEARFLCINFALPIYLSAALLAACKKIGIKCEKKKILSVSRLAPKVFQPVFEEMSSLLVQLGDQSKPVVERNTQSAGKGKRTLKEAKTRKTKFEVLNKKFKMETVEDMVLYSPFSADFQAWKSETLKEAKEKILNENS